MDITPDFGSGIGGSNPLEGAKYGGRGAMVAHLDVAQAVGGSNPLDHPNKKPTQKFYESAFCFGSKSYPYCGRQKTPAIGQSHFGHLVWIQGTPR